MGFFDFLKKQKKAQVVEQPNNTVINQPIYVQPTPVKKGNVKNLSVDTTIDNIEKAKRRFIAIDFETTGLNPYSDRIIEVGAVVFENGSIVDRMERLINPGISIPESAQRVNHISNDMVKNAPNEATVIRELVEFISDAITGDTFLCAYNSNFDSKFLEMALERNGYDATLYFLDTLTLSRKVLYFDNYKQATLANHFGIVNTNSHRAVADAETCGLIMFNLCDLIIEKLHRDEVAVERTKEIAMLTDEQKEWCACIQDQLVKSGFDTEYLVFRGQSANYVSCEYIYTFLKIKFGKSKKYIIAKKGKFKKSDYITEPCTASEGGEGFLRVIFAEPFEIETFIEYIASEYKKICSSVKRDIREGVLTFKKLEMYMRFSTKISSDEIPTLLSSAKSRIETKRAEQEQLKPEKQRLEEEKLIKKVRREEEKLKKASEVKTPRTRAIIQMNDDGTVVNEFISISEAVDKTG